MLKAVFAIQIAEMAANMRGVVYDAGATAVPNTCLQLINQKPEKVQQLHSSGAGAFHFRALKPGSYALCISAPGFGETLLPNLDIRAGEKRSFSPSLLSERASDYEPRRLRIGGTVQLNAAITREGSLSELHVISSPHAALTNPPWLQFPNGATAQLILTENRSKLKPTSP